MINKKKFKSTTKPYFHNVNIAVFYEMTHGKDYITVGTPLRFKYDRATYRFLKMVHNSEKNKTWIDCMDMTNGTFKSFYVEDLKGVIKPKKTRKRRAIVSGT